MSTIARRVIDACVSEALAAEPARVAATAGAAFVVGLVAGNGAREVDAVTQAGLDDLGFRPRDQRRVHPEALAFDPGLGRQVRERLERADELRPAVRIAGIVDRVDAAEQIV